MVSGLLLPRVTGSLNTLLLVPGPILPAAPWHQPSPSVIVEFSSPRRPLTPPTSNLSTSPGNSTSKTQLKERGPWLSVVTPRGPVTRGTVTAPNQASGLHSTLILSTRYTAAWGLSLSLNHTRKHVKFLAECSRIFTGSPQPTFLPWSRTLPGFATCFLGLGCLAFHTLPGKNPTSPEEQASWI